jgi:zinc transporter ZupT
MVLMRRVRREGPWPVRHPWLAGVAVGLSGIVQGVAALVLSALAGASVQVCLLVAVGCSLAGALGSFLVLVLRGQVPGS